MLEIKKGDFFTVKKWVKTNDRSYIGDIFQVQAIDLPFISASRHSGFIFKDGNMIFSLDEVVLKKLSDEFVNSIVPGLLNPFRSSEF